MSEADKIADALREEFRRKFRGSSFVHAQAAREFVREHIPLESLQMIENVVWSLLRED